MTGKARLHAILPPRGRCGADPDLRWWLHHGDRLADAPPGYIGALQAQFQSPGTALPVAALMRERLCGDAGQDYWLCADPAHIEVAPNGARMLACGTLDITAEEAQELARDLRPLFGDHGALLEITTPSRWHLRLPHGARPPAFSSAEQAMGADLFAELPQGTDGRKWRRLFNEIQVLLHQHPLNVARRQRGQMSVNALWFWGGGELPMWMKSPLASVYSDDVLAQAMAARCGITCRHAADFDATTRLSADALLDQDAATGAPWTAWLHALRRGRYSEIALYFVDGSRWRLKRWHRWRFWRCTR